LLPEGHLSVVGVVLPLILVGLPYFYLLFSRLSRGGGFIERIEKLKLETVKHRNPVEEI